MNFRIIFKFIVLLVFSSVGFTANRPPISKPLSILIIGGGPAGLATAIEAKESGAQVTIIEKRTDRSRLQRLFLFDSSIQLLKKWKVTVPHMQVVELEDGSSLGFVAINDLEEGLENRVQELGVQKILGECQSFDMNNTALILTPSNEQLKLSYDIIVGADGAYSSMKERLGIKTNVLGSAKGSFAFVFDRDDQSTEIDVSPPIKGDLGFLRRIKAASVSILFMQSSESSSKEQLQEMATACGWQREALLIGKGQAFISTDIPVTLQQAQTFSSEDKAAILVGDAAATASFFQGMGGNTALKTAEKAGQFFKEVKKDRAAAYRSYNQGLVETTGTMIEDSSFLFSS